MDIKKIIAGIVAIFALGAGGGVVLGGLTYDATVKWFGNGIYVGKSQELSVDSSGNIVTTGGVTATGNLTASGGLTLSGAAVVGTFTQGGGITSTSTTATVGTLQAADVDTENVIDVTPLTAGMTLTLFASTTAGCPSTAGQTRTIFIRNATTTAATNVTIAGGTGVILKRASSTVGSLIQGDTDASNYAKLEVTKKANTDCVALMTLYND